MRTAEISVYKFAELSDAAKEKVRTWYREGNDLDNRNGREAMDSLKALFDNMCGVDLSDWRIGPYRSFIRVVFYRDEVGELSGKRAIAWLENNLLYKLRIPFVSEKRWKLSKYGACYRPGMIKPCPFTGVCWDELIIDDIRTSLRSGMTLADSLCGLADTLQSTLESEDEYQNSDAVIDENMIETDYEFTEDGSIY